MALSVDKHKLSSVTHYQTDRLNEVALSLDIHKLSSVTLPDRSNGVA